MGWDTLSDEQREVRELVRTLARERVAPRAAEIACLRYFAGLTVLETAAVLGVSARTVEREWTFARSYLAAVMSELAGRDG